MISRSISTTMLALALSVPALAVPMVQSNPLLSFQDIDSHNATLTAGQVVQGTFDIVTAAAGSTTIITGYANAGQTFSDIGGYVLNTPILSANAYFYIQNGNQGNDVVSINLGGTSINNGNTPATYSILEGLASISVLQTNGSISYSVTQSTTNPGASFVLNYAQLQGTVAPTTPNNPRVPEGSSVAILLGMSFLGLVSARRIFGR